MAAIIALTRDWENSGLELLNEFDFPPVDEEKVYLEIFEQVENFKKNKG